MVLNNRLLIFHTFSYQSTGPTAKCSLPALHPGKELKKSVLSEYLLAYDPGSKKTESYSLPDTGAESRESYYASDIHGKVEERSMNFYICSILRHSKDVTDHLTVSA